MQKENLLRKESLKKYTLLLKREMGILVSAIIFYLVGVFGFSWEKSRLFFLSLIPFVLIFHWILVFSFHETPKKRWVTYTLMSVFVLSLLVEIIGVHSEKVFGAYHYGAVLGLRIAGVPLLIGINWAGLLYCMAILADRYFRALWKRVLIIASGLLLYDIIMEPAAQALGMWQWHEGLVPMRNYLMWFLLGGLFGWFFKGGKGVRNTIALPLFFVQAGFFLLIDISLWLSYLS